VAYEGASAFEEVADLQRALMEAKAKIKTSFATVRSASEILATKQLDAKDRFAVKHEAFLLTYAAAIEEQGKHSNLIEEVARLNAELQTAEAAQARARSTELAQSNADKISLDALVG
jgi:hypothetical protein